MKIQFQNITKRYHQLIAVNNLNLSIHDGEFLVVLGPSGSGKSTTLNMLAGLEIPTSGYLFFNERAVNTLPPGKRDIALVFQNYALYPHMKSYDNIAFPLRVRREKDIHRRVLKTAESLGLSGFLEKYPRELSGGQRQRVALARALVRNPSVFLMDEPLSNLDPPLRHSAREELKRLQGQRNVTTVYVTHDQTEALTLGDRIAILNKGNLQQVGTPAEIYENPQNTFIAGFIGTPPMNMVQTQSHTSNAFRVEGNIIEYPVHLPAMGNPILGIRPEKLTLVPVTTPHTIPGTIEYVEYLGHESISHIKITPVTTWYVKDVLKEKPLGSQVGLKFSPRDTHWFDPVTQDRLNL